MRRPRGPRNERPVDDDEAERGAQAAPAGVGEREDGRADRRARRRSAHSTAGASPVSTRDHGDVGVDVDARDRAGLAASAGERDGDLVAAQVVRVRQHEAVADDDARPASPAAARGRRRTGPTRSATRAIAAAQLSKNSHAAQLLTSNLQVTYSIRTRSWRLSTSWRARMTTIAACRDARRPPADASPLHHALDARRRQVDAAPDRRAARRPAALRRPARGGARHRPEHPHPAAAPPRARGARRRAALLRAPAALLLRADRRRRRAGRRAAPARPTGAPARATPSRRATPTAARRSRCAGGARRASSRSTTPTPRTSTSCEPLRSAPSGCTLLACILGLGDRVPRRHRRERRAAGAPGGPGREPGRAAVGRRGLHAHAVVAAARRRLARRPVRPAHGVRAPASRASA